MKRIHVLLAAAMLIASPGCASSPRGVEPTTTSEPRPGSEGAMAVEPAPPSLPEFSQGLRESGEDDERMLVLDLLTGDGSQMRFALTVADPGGWVSIEQPSLTLAEDCDSLMVSHQVGAPTLGRVTPPVVRDDVPHIPLDALVSPFSDSETLPRVVLRLCGTNVTLEGEAVEAYTAFVRRAAELRSQPALLDAASPVVRTGTWGRQITVHVTKPDEPLFELRPATADQPARVRVVVTQITDSDEPFDECPLTFRGVSGLRSLPLGPAQSEGVSEGRHRHTTHYLIEDVSALEALASARRVRVANCLGPVPLSDDTRAAVGRMPARLEELTASAP